MTRALTVHLVRASAPIFLYCPTCAGSDLWCEALPCGDYPVDCLSCGNRHLCAQVEEVALQRIRRTLRRSIPCRSP